LLFNGAKLTTEATAAKATATRKDIIVIIIMKLSIKYEVSHVSKT